MTKRNDAARWMLVGIARPTQRTVCWRCRANGLLRTYASAAVAASEQPQVTITSTTPAESSAPKPFFRLRAGVVLSRPPQITRDLTSFEKAYFLYQRRLNERLSLPFTRYFYFRKDTPADIDWKRKFKERQTPARDIGVYNPYSKLGWDDELKVGAPESEPDHQLNALLRDAQTSAAETTDADTSASQDEAQAVERPPSRVTEADQKNDQKSLNRALQRTLHLIVRNKDGRWEFPADVLAEKESLRMAAERILVGTGGINMNTWVVGNMPIGWGKFRIPGGLITSEGSRQLGDKVFFMKARIMTGQANLSSNKFGHEDFRWLVKEEIPQFVTAQYWNKVHNMLPQR